MHNMCYYHDHDTHQAVLPTSSSWPRNSAMTPTAGKNSQVSPISSSFLLHSSKTLIQKLPTKPFLPPPPPKSHFLQPQTVAAAVATDTQVTLLKF